MNRVLIVDDNPVNVKVLMTALQESGYDLLSAPTGERAFQIAQRAQPNLILLDINMPGWNGFETCEKLKELKETAHIPVIFLSALDDTESKVEGFKKGGVDYITKPFNKEEVLIRVRTHLKIAALSHELEKQNQVLNDSLEEIRAIQSQLASTNELLLDSIQYSQRIQEAILPRETELCQLYPDSFVLFRPKNIVSGDFYWFHQRRNKRFIVASDCTGHGVPGAFMSLIGINLLNHLVEDMGITEPASILEEMDYKLKKLLRQEEDQSITKDGMDIAICSIDERTMNMQYSSAMRPIFLFRNKELIKLNANRFSIGGGQIKHTGFQNSSIQLEKGDNIYLFSDGFADQFGGPKNKKIKSGPFMQILSSIQDFSMIEQKEKLFSALEAWQGFNDQTDDILVIGVKID